MKLIRERAGDTLTGAVDGTNQRFVTTFDYVVGDLVVYLNGLRLQAAPDNGWIPQPPRDIVMKQPPYELDTLEVEYLADVATGGGHLGGRPDPPTLTTMEPRVEVLGENVPRIETSELEPAATVTNLRPTLLSDELRPSITTDSEPETCP